MYLLGVSSEWHAMDSQMYMGMWRIIRIQELVDVSFGAQAFEADGFQTT